MRVIEDLGTCFRVFEVLIMNLGVVIGFLFLFRYWTVLL